MPSRYADPTLWVDACDQAVSVAAKSFLACVGTNAIDITSTGFVGALNVSAVAAFLSLLASIAGAPADTGDHGSIR